MALKPNRPSEFGGHQQRNTIAPPITPAGTKGHTPTKDEIMRLRYLTGQDEDSTMDPVTEAFEGLDPIEEAEARAPKPQKWRDM